MSQPQSSAPAIEAVVQDSSGISKSPFITTSIQQSPSNNPTKPFAESSAETKRRIIYRATIDVVVDSFDGVSDGILRLCDRFSGFVASANAHGLSGTQRQGTWVLRVPSDQYRTFLSSASELGEVTSTREESQEVTAEFYDLQARIRNKEREEQRLIELLEEQTGKLPDILSVEKELARVRGEVEQHQGRLRFLSDLTSFSTITLSIREVRNYVPAAAPSFLMKVVRTLDQSLGRLVEFGASCTLLTVAVLPWLLVVVVIGWPAFQIVKWRLATAK